jgi:hypothetical protein
MVRCIHVGAVEDKTATRQGSLATTGATRPEVAPGRELAAATADAFVASDGEIVLSDPRRTRPRHLRGFALASNVVGLPAPRADSIDDR